VPDSTDPVSIIVPTTASAARADMLRRALHSLEAQAGARARAIVVANGPRADAGVLAELAADRRVTLIRREEGNLPKALAAGREAVDTGYFGVLDDDDEYLPDAIALRRAPLDRDASVDAVAGCGLRVADGGGDELLFADIESYKDSPLLALSRGNWLPSCAGLYRTASIGAQLFHDMPALLEWTYFAARLCLAHKLVFIGQPTYRIHPGSPGSLSSSNAYVLRIPDALEKIIALGLPPTTRRSFATKLHASRHIAAMHNMEHGDLAAAWRSHLASLRGADALRYGAFTRHLLWRQIGRWAGR
jgi:glycosyltransferase involved in cell wall biosynthesis